MPIRPTGLPRWATNGSGITEPTDAKKALGWGATGASGERPPAQYFNWLSNLNGEWLRYLSYEMVIDDDFVPFLTNPYEQKALGDSGFWVATGLISTWFTLFGNSHARYVFDSEAEGAGVAQLGYAGAAMATGVLLKGVGSPGNKDFIFEALIKRPIGVGLVSVGIQNELCFTASGSGSLTWGVGWNPTYPPNSAKFGGATGFDTGVAIATSYYQRLTFERVGVTTVAEIDGQRVAAFNQQYSFGAHVTTAPNLSGSRVGVHTIGSNISTPTGHVWIDRIRFGIRR